MKLLTKEEEAAHYRATLTGGTLGGLTGLAFGAAGVYLASRRYHFMNNLTLPLKAFLVTSSGTFAGIISADHASRAYESERNPKEREYRELQQRDYEAAHAGMTFTQRAMEFGKKERYKIVGASWLASMVGAFAIVNRNKYLTGPQKLVQARVYAQFLTLGVLVASAAFEISDSHNDEGKLWETKRIIDPNDPEHKRVIEEKVPKNDGAGETTDGDPLWKEMVAAEEEREREKEEEKKQAQAQRRKKQGGAKQKGHEEKGKKEDDKNSKKDDSKDEKKDDKQGKKEKK